MKPKIKYLLICGLGLCALALAAVGGLYLTGKRDDRFIAAFNLGVQYRPSNARGPEPQPQFRVAYIARAVTVGRFALPPAHAKDMYAPAITARTSVGLVNVGE